MSGKDPKAVDKDRKKELKKLEKEQKKKEKQDKKLEKERAKDKKKIDPSAISIGGPVLVKATNEIINRAQERKIPEGYLLHLVESGNLSEIQRIKYPKEELDFRNKHGQTPLHVACQEGLGPNNGYDIAKALVAMGANVNATDSNGWTSLHAACKSYRSPELVVLLGCVCGTGAGERNRDGNTPLHFLARVRLTPEHTFVCEKGITSLLEHGGDINAKNNNGETPFHCALMLENYEMLPLLIKHGADITAVTDNGHNAMHIAVLAENVFAVKKLLELGVDPRIATTTQPSPYDLVKHTRNRRKEICDLFQIPDERFSLLVLFTRECDESDYSDVERLKNFKYSTEEANERDTAGNVPLYYAVMNPSVTPPVIQFLISIGADVNAKCADGRSILFIACQEDRVEIVNALLAAKPDITTRDPEHGRLPIHEFVLRAAPSPDRLPAYEKALDAFCGLGADLNGPLSDDYQEKLLHVVTNVAMFKLLIDKDANPNVTTKMGRGILVEAIIKQNKELVSAILALEQVDPRVGGEEGTALEVAKRGVGDKAQDIYQLVSKEAVSWDIKDMTPEEKRAYRRGKAVDELVTTEQEYLADLDILINLYYLPIKARSEPKEGSTEQPLLDPMQVKSIFGDIEMIREVSATMATRLAQCKDQPGQPFGKLFLDNLQLLSKYEKVCTSQASTEEFLNKALSAKNAKTNEPSEFAKFCEEQKRNPLCRKLPIGGFIIKPFQRITKLPLLLREIQSLTEETHPDYQHLTKAKEEIEKIIGSANQKQKNMDGLRELLAIQARFVWDDAEEIINLGDNKARLFTLECDVKALTVNAKPALNSKKKDDGKLSPRHLFVFSDIVVLTKPEKKGILPFLFHLPLALTFIEDIKDNPTDSKAPKNAFSLTYVSAQQIVTVSCKDPAEKLKIFDAIKSNIEKIRSPDLSDPTVTEERKSGELKGVTSKQIAYKTLDLGQPASQSSPRPAQPSAAPSQRGADISAPVLGATTNPHLAAQQGASLIARPSGAPGSPNSSNRTLSMSTPNSNALPGTSEWARERVKSMDLSGYNHQAPATSAHKRNPRPRSSHGGTTIGTLQSTPSSEQLQTTEKSFAPPPSTPLPSAPSKPASFSPSGPTSFSPSGPGPSGPPKPSNFSPSTGGGGAVAAARATFSGGNAPKPHGSYFTIRERNLHVLEQHNKEFNSPPPTTPTTPPTTTPVNRVVSPPVPSHDNNHNNHTHAPSATTTAEVGTLHMGRFEKNLNSTLKKGKNKKPSKGFMAAIDKKRVAPNPTVNK